MADDLFYRVSVDAAGVAYDLSTHIASLTIEQRDDKPDQLTVDVADAYKVLGHALQEGMDVEVDIGSTEDHSVVFRGRIYKVEGDFPKDAVPRLKLMAYDGTMRMGLRKRNRTFKDVTLSSIVETVAGEYFTDVSVSVLGDPTFSGNGIRQDDETDLAFLLRLASTYGCVMYARADDEGEVFNFIAQLNVMTATPEVIFYYGRCDIEHRLLSFHSSADVSEVELPRVLSGIDYETGQPTEVAETTPTPLLPEEDAFFDENLTAFRERDPIKAAQLELLLAAAPAVQEAIRQELGTTRREATATFTSEAELQTLAQNQFSLGQRGMRASGAALGVKDLLARTSVDVEDVGGRFSGVWYLSLVRHHVDRLGFNTDFECRR